MGDTRLCVDIDVINFERKWDLIFTLLRTIPHRCEYHLTNKGCHIIFHDLPDREDLRLWFGDDYNRVEMDRERTKFGLRTNVLFIAKNGVKYEVTCDVFKTIEHIKQKYIEWKKKRKF